MENANITETGSLVGQMAIDSKMEFVWPDEKEHIQFLRENCDMSHYQPNLPPSQLALGTRQLHQILEALQNEIRVHPDDLPTSFADVENTIALCICECLQYSSDSKLNVLDILSLVKDSKVLLPVRGGNPTVSLDKVHLILQDNFPDSYLCKLFNILIAGFMNTTPKVISFF